MLNYLKIGIPFLIVAVIALFIWITIELKRIKHKLFAIFLIGLILFAYGSFSYVTYGEEIDFKSFGGWMIAGKMYMSWLGTIGSNLFTISSNAVNMEWKASSKDKNE
jgi:formate/nitrite transporter FocA (FNT family)